MLSKSLIQFSVDGRGCVPSLFFVLRPNYVGGNEDNSDLLQKAPCTDCHTQCPQPSSRPPQPMPLPETPGHSQASLHQSLVGSLLLSPGPCCVQGFVCALQESVSPVPTGLQSKFSGGFQSICQIPRVGNLLWVLELFLTVREFLWYNCSAIFGLPAWWLYGGINSNLLQEGLCHRLCDPGSVQFSHSVVSDSLRSMDLQHSRLPCPSPTPEACSNSCPFSW